MSEDLIIRDYRGGDLGLVLKHHGELYARDLGWGIRFEGYVAATLAEFAKNYDAENERLWIAERDGAFVGCVGVVKAAAQTAQLRWLLVMPEARGLGLGIKLTNEVLAFARNRGYRDCILWTEAGRETAKAIYAKLGFRLIETKQSTALGAAMTEEKWAIEL